MTDTPTILDAIEWLHNAEQNLSTADRQTAHAVPLLTIGLSQVRNARRLIEKITDEDE